MWGQQGKDGLEGEMGFSWSWIPMWGWGRKGTIAKGDSEITGMETGRLVEMSWGAKADD